MKGRRAITAAVSIAVLTGLAACGLGLDPTTTTGKVVGRHYTHFRGSVPRYTLDIAPKGGGDSTRIHISHGTYRVCFRGSSYPRCMDRKSH